VAMDPPLMMMLVWKRVGPPEKIVETTVSVTGGKPLPRVTVEVTVTVVEAG